MVRGVRPSRMVAGAALTASLALGALPGLVGSAGPSPVSVIDPSSFQSVQVPAFATTDLPVAPLDDVFRAASPIDSSTTLARSGHAPKLVVPTRPVVVVPASQPGS